MAELEVTVLSPNGQSLPITTITKPNGSQVIEFIPNVTGHYKVTILYGGEPVPSTPITFAVTGSGSKSEAYASGTGLEIAHRGKETSFVVFCPTTPNVQIEQCDEKQGDKIEPKIKSLGNNEWRIYYTILSVGKFEIRASCPNRGPLPGSPWIISCIDHLKVTPVGGWSVLLDNEGRLVLPTRITFDTALAGPGELLCCINGSDIQVEKLADGRLRLFMNGENLAPGEHNFDLTWSGIPVSQCPGMAFVTNQQSADKVILTGRGLAAAHSGDPAHFTIGK